MSKSYSRALALASVSLTIFPGEVHALLGENGSGKSTLIKVLSGYVTPDAGVVQVAGHELPFGNAHASHDAGLRFVHQNLGLVETESVLDNLSLNIGYPTRLGVISTRRARAEAEAALAQVGLDVDPRVRVADLTPAQRTGVAIARALRSLGSSSVHAVVFDEPTATLPDDEVQRLLGIIRSVVSQGVGVLYVTHRIDEVFEIAHRATILRDGRVVATRDVEGLTRARLLHDLVGLEFEEAQQHTAELKAPGSQALLHVRDLRGRHLNGVDLEVHPGEILGIAGITGSGREQLCAHIFGASTRSAGTVEVGGHAIRAGRPDAAMRCGTAYIPADRAAAGIILSQSARENITLTDLRPSRRGPLINGRAERAEVDEWLRKLSVRPLGSSELPLSAFSGGNQQKIVFAKWLRTHPRVILLDEPTQGVDVAAKAQLHEQCAAAAVIVSSSDIDELAAVCTRVLVMRRGLVVAELGAGHISVAALSKLSLLDAEDGNQ